MSEKLTNSVREMIANDIIQHRFGNARSLIDAAEAEIGLAVYHEAFSKKERDLMASLPDGWLYTTNTTTGRFGSGSDFHQFRIGQLIRLPYNRVNGAMVSLDRNHPLSLRYLELKERRREHEAAVQAARREIKPILAGAYSIRALRKIWPEIAPFLDKHEVRSAGPKVKLPAIQMQTLNSLLNLPPEKIEVAA